MRLVPNQKSEEITKLFIDHFTSIAPKGVTVKVTPHHGGEAYVMHPDGLEFQAASKAYIETFGKAPIPVRDGGSIPIVALFEETLQSKTVLMGFGLDSDAIHSPNEHFGVFNFLKGIETIPHFYKHFTKMQQEQRCRRLEMHLLVWFLGHCYQYEEDPHPQNAWLDLPNAGDSAIPSRFPLPVAIHPMMP